MLALFLALSAPELPVVYEQLRAEVRPVPPPPISELLDQIRDAKNPTEQAQLLERLVSRCGGLDVHEQLQTVAFLENMPARGRITLGQCSYWLRDTAFYERSVGSLLSPRDAYGTIGLSYAAKRLNAATLSTAQKVVDYALEPIEPLLLYNALSARPDVRVEEGRQDALLRALEDQQQSVDYRYLTLRAVYVSIWRTNDYARWRLRVKEAFRQMGEREPDPRLRQLARQYYERIPQ